jgi:hypothetical protein
VLVDVVVELGNRQGAAATVWCAAGRVVGVARVAV